MPHGILAKDIVNRSKIEVSELPPLKKTVKLQSNREDRIALAKQLIVTLDRCTLRNAGYLSRVVQPRPTPEAHLARHN